MKMIKLCKLVLQNVNDLVVIHMYMYLLAQVVNCEVISWRIHYRIPSNV